VSQEAPSPKRPKRACLLVSRPVLSHGAPEPPWLRACLLVSGPWLASQARPELRARLRIPSIGSLRLPRALEPLAEALACSGLGWFLGLRVHASIPDGYSP
jgi:hypothetical protein